MLPVSLDEPRVDVSVDELGERLVSSFLGIGVPHDEAQAAASVCLEAELLGRTSHGIRLVSNVAREYRMGTERRRDARVERDGPAFATIDAGYHCSLWAHRWAAELCARKAQASGVAVVSIHSAGVSGALGVHAEAMAQAGLCAVALNAAPAVVVAPGTAAPVVGTNPLAVAVPRGEDPPIVLDMATSAISFNAVMQALATGAELPAGVAVDASGDFTTNPGSAVDEDGRGRLAAFGGHRGFGIALMIEMLVAGGVAHVIGTAKRDGRLVDPDFFPGLYLAWRPDSVGDPVQFAESVETYLRELDQDAVRVPGAASSTRRERARRSGRIVVDRESLSALDLLAEGPAR